MGGSDVVQLTERLARAQDEYIAALEEPRSTSGERMKQLEHEIEEVEKLRRHCVDQSEKVREEAVQRRSHVKKLIHLVWSSSFASPLKPAEVADIRRHAEDANMRKGVTGMLVFSCSAEQFLQVLEGDADVVDKLYASISADKRLKGVVLLRRQVIEQRRFADWPMQLIDLADLDKPEQPLQQVIEVLSRYVTIADACMQSAMRAALVRGGNPLFLQPKRTKVVTLLVGLHSKRAFTAPGIPAAAASDTLRCFVDTCARCVVMQNGTVVNAAGDVLHAQWQFNQLQQAKAAVDDIIAALAELRGLSKLSAVPSDPPPQLPLCALAWPCVALAAGRVVINRQTIPSQVSLDVVGPAVTDARNALDAGLAAGKQVVVSANVAAAFSSARHRVAFQEIKTLPPIADDSEAGPCFALDGVDDCPDSLSLLVGRLVDELNSNGTVPIQPQPMKEVPPKMAAPAPPQQSSTPAHEYREQIDSDDTTRPAFAAGDVSRVLVSEGELRAQFNALDANGNGWVSKAEFRDFFDQYDAMGIYDMHDKVDDILEQHNMLGDDRLSFDEFSILMLKLAQS